MAHLVDINFPIQLLSAPSTLFIMERESHQMFQNVLGFWLSKWKFYREVLMIMNN